MIYSKFLIESDKIKTFTGNGLMTRGYSWFRDNYYESEGLAELFSGIITPEAFFALLKELNGCFSIYFETDNFVFLASDKFATYPLFYSRHDENIYVSDRVSYIVKSTGNKKVNENAVRDITYTGYTYLNETLISGINQVIASECIVINKSDLSVNRTTYFLYSYDKSKLIETESATSMFDEICKKVSKRLIQSLGGRNCVVFLSGGVDSRFCAYLLKIGGYSDKTTLITYGSKLSPDYSPAVKTASALNMKHMCIPYKRKNWENTYKDKDSLSYLKYSQNISISAHLREHFVVRELLDNKTISKEDIIIPGHLGTVAGREYTKEQLCSISSTHKRLIDKTVLFYNMERFPDGNEYLLSRTKSLFPPECSSTDPLYYLSIYNNAASCTYSIKYLINSLRAYDYYGMEWRLPLLDTEIIDFFNCLPFEAIVNKRFFKEYVSSKINVPYSEFSLNFILKVFRNILDKRYLCIDLSKIFKLKNDYNGHLSVLTRAYRYVRNFSTYCAVYELDIMKKELADI